MRFTNLQSPRNPNHRVKGTSNGLPYVIRLLDGNWKNYKPTFKDQRADGYDEEICWNYGFLRRVATNINFLLKTGALPQTHIDFLNKYPFIDVNGSVAFSEEFIAALATYSNGQPVRDGGNDQMNCLDYVNEFGLIPQTMFDADPNLTFADQEAFDDYYFDKTRITPSMYAIGKEFLTYFSVEAQWIGAEGVTPSDSEIQACMKQAPLQVGIPIPKEVSLWNYPNVKWDGTTVVSHSVGLEFLEPAGIRDIDDQYQPEEKFLSSDYPMPLTMMVLVTPRLIPPFIVPPTAVPLPDPTSLIVRIWQAIKDYWNRQNALGKVKIA